MDLLSEAYVLGLLADHEGQVPRLANDLAQQRQRAQAVQPELSEALKRLDVARTRREEAQDQVAGITAEILDRNKQGTALMNEMGALSKRMEQLQDAYQPLSDGPEKRALVRERAKVSVQVDDRQEALGVLRDEAAERRTKLEVLEPQVKALRDAERLGVTAIRELQSRLADPYAYPRLSEACLARAHCRFYLDRDLAAWMKEVRTAIGVMVQLHDELRRGVYRLDKNSELVGGRCVATGEAIYGAVAVGENQLASDLMQLATDPSLLFHEIFAVLRVWLVGLYLAGRHKGLRSLLQRYQYAHGLRGAYVQCFDGLLRKDGKAISVGLKHVAKHEWAYWSAPKRARGAGVVCLGGAAIAKLALDANIAVSLPGPTVPDEIIAGPRDQRAGGRP